MKLSELSKELEAQHFRPAYLLAGGEALLRDDALALLRSAIIGDQATDFNLERLDASSSPAALCDALRSLPIMADRRLVILREPGSRRGGARKLLEVLSEEVKLMRDREPIQCVLVVSASQVDRREAWVKAFAKPAAVVDCEAPRKTRELVGFVEAEARRQELVLEHGVAALLVERIGAQLLLLRQEITKAALLAGAGEPLRREHVLAATSDLAEESIWELTDAIGEGKRSAALRRLAGLLRDGEPAPLILGALANHFRKLLRSASGEALSGPPFVVKKISSQAQRFSPARLRRCLEAIHEADLVLKGKGSLSPEHALEHLVMGLAA